MTLWDSVANPDLESEKSLNKELGYRWSSGRHQLGISVYHDKYTNFIEDTTFIRNPQVGLSHVLGQQLLGRARQ